MYIHTGILKDKVCDQNNKSEAIEENSDKAYEEEDMTTGSSSTPLRSVKLMLTNGPVSWECPRHHRWQF
jgi:hypothetical protein